MKKKLNQVFLTFDVEGLPPYEDFLDNYSLVCISKILDLLEEKGLRGIFFITGFGAEQIRKYPSLVDRLSCNIIGYHSSFHNARPGIIEYTDVPSYEEAVAVSLNRETSHINPETGQVEGRGGIFALRETFPKNDIECFRAPFLGWSPPHLEALKKLGIRFDFSSSILDHPVYFKGITFYPNSIAIDDGVEATFAHRGPRDIFHKPLIGIFLRRKVTVLSMHPPTLLVKNPFAGRDKYRIGGKVRTKFIISLLKLFLHRIYFLQKNNLINVTPLLSQNWQPLNPEEIDVEKMYQQSIQSFKRLFYVDPQFVFSHFSHFFSKKVEPERVRFS